jgi:hypothetical protein
MMARGQIKSYKFEVGNSGDGALGMAIRVWARTKAEAVAKANHFLSTLRPIELAEANYQTGIEYCTVYVSPNLSPRQIAGGCEIEEVSPELAVIVADSLEE